METIGLILLLMLGLPASLMSAPIQDDSRVNNSAETNVKSFSPELSNETSNETSSENSTDAEPADDDYVDVTSGNGEMGSGDTVDVSGTPGRHLDSKDTRKDSHLSEVKEDPPLENERHISADSNFQQGSGSRVEDVVTWGDEDEMADQDLLNHKMQEEGSGEVVFDIAGSNGEDEDDALSIWNNTSSEGSGEDEVIELVDLLGSGEPDSSGDSPDEGVIEINKDEEEIYSGADEDVITTSTTPRERPLGGKGDHSSESHKEGSLAGEDEKENVPTQEIPTHTDDISEAASFTRDRGRNPENEKSEIAVTVERESESNVDQRGVRQDSTPREHDDNTPPYVNPTSSSTSYETYKPKPRRPTKSTLSEERGSVFVEEQSRRTHAEETQSDYESESEKSLSAPNGVFGSFGYDGFTFDANGFIDKSE